MWLVGLQKESMIEVVDSGKSVFVDGDVVAGRAVFSMHAN